MKMSLKELLSAAKEVWYTYVFEENMAVDVCIFASYDAMKRNRCIIDRLIEMQGGVIPFALLHMRVLDTERNITKIDVKRFLEAMR